MPADRAWVAAQAGARMRARLPERHDRPGRILDDRHAALVHDIHRRHADLAAGGLGFFDGPVNAPDRNVRQPEWRHLGFAFLSGHRIKSADVLAADAEHRVLGVAHPHGKVFDLPAENALDELIDLSRENGMWTEPELMNQ